VEEADAEEADVDDELEEADAEEADVEDGLQVLLPNLAERLGP